MKSDNTFYYALLIRAFPSQDLWNLQKLFPERILNTSVSEENAFICWPFQICQNCSAWHKLTSSQLFLYNCRDCAIVGAPVATHIAHKAEQLQRFVTHLPYHHKLGLIDELDYVYRLRRIVREANTRKYSRDSWLTRINRFRYKSSVVSALQQIAGYGIHEVLSGWEDFEDTETTSEQSEIKTNRTPQEIYNLMRRKARDARIRKNLEDTKS